MANFKERQASAKKVIQLQNEVLILKQQLSNSSSQDPCEECEECEDCTNLVQEVQSILDTRNEELTLLKEEILSLKADLKKVRSENTRLKKKLKDAPLEEEN